MILHNTKVLVQAQLQDFSRLRKREYFCDVSLSFHESSHKLKMQ